MKSPRFHYALILCAILLPIAELSAQTAPRLVNFPTPNSASLGLYTNTPVSHFTGTPDISIPLYEVVEGPIKMPIALTYHPSSVRVHSHPGWVGLGWSLQAGGAITRTVHGKLDEFLYKFTTAYTGGSGFYATYDQLAGTDSDWQSDTRLETYRSINYVYPGIQEKPDVQPDEFNFSFMGYSGKFFMGHDGQWKVISDQKIKVEFNPAVDPNTGGFVAESGLRSNLTPRPDWGGYSSVKDYYTQRYFFKFTLITPDGTRFDFGGHKDAIEYSVPFRQQDMRIAPIATTWYLTKITTSEGGQIILGYIPANAGELVHNLQQFYTNTLMNRNATDDWGIADLGVDCSSYFSGSTTDGDLMFPVYLKSITYSQGNLTFDTSITNELPGMNVTDVFSSGVVAAYFLPNVDYQSQIKWRKLDRILIANYSHPTLYEKEFLFTYSDNPSTRLKLWKLQEGYTSNPGTNPPYLFTQAIPPYVFTYNTASLPGYNSVAVDHWDFYNHSGIVPSTNQQITTNQGGYYVSRDPDPSGSYTKAEVLERIEYPTGGIKKFEYEPHTYRKYVKRDGLAAGTVKYPVITLTGNANNTAGGLRIKRILSYDSPIETNPSLIKEYFYVQNFTNGVDPSTLSSSGILAGAPNYFWSYSGKDYGGTSYTYDLFSSGTVLPYGYNVSGSHIGYSEVVEVSRNAAGSINGYTRFKFTNFDTEGDASLDELGKSVDPARSVYSPFSSNELLRGKPKSEEIWTVGNKQLQQVNYLYTLVSNGYARRVRQEYMDLCPEVTASAQIAFASAYKSYDQWYQLTGKQVIDYDGLNTLTTAYTYSYTSQNFLSQEVKTNSDGSTLQTITKYPSDYTLNDNITSGSWEAIGISKMVKKGMLNTPIEQIVLKGITVISGKFTGYSVSGEMVLPFKQWSLETATPLSLGLPIGVGVGNETNLFNQSSLYYDGSAYQVGRDEHYTATPVVFNQYDIKGNLQEYFVQNNVPTCILWSYNYTLPVAEIVGLNFSQLPSTVGGFTHTTFGIQTNTSNIKTALDTFRSSLPQAQITTYTYNSGKVATMTDANGKVTTYEYDSLGRLITIKDPDGKVVKAFKYKYRSE